MATFFKINAFSEALAEKVHNLGSDQLKVALINSAPSAGHTQLSSLTEISYTNCSSRLITTSSSVAEFDYGSALTLASGESLTLDFDGTNGLLQLV
jgi:hypothetical protein